MKKNIRSKGFTLIELLAVMIILMAVGTMITAILITSLQGGDKSSTVNTIRDNGNFAISQMSKMIAYSQQFVKVGRFTPSISHTDCIGSNSGNYDYVTIESFDGGQTTFKCDSTNNTIASGSASLINTAVASVSNCYFICQQYNLDSPPTVAINFDLSSLNSNFFEKKATIHFSTSVTLRNNP